MGYFSWLTADTKESIPNENSGREMRPVYLLQPGGEPPLCEESYEGYGVFAGIDAFDWLALMNLETDVALGLDADLLRDVGCRFSGDGYLLDTETGRKYTVFHRGADVIDPEITHLDVNYQTKLDEFGGLRPNELVASGRWVRTPIETQFPLKFSFDKDAVYEDLPESERCPAQGYFYGPEWDDDDDDED